MELASFRVRAERALVLHLCLPQVQQLGVLLGVHPPQVLHVLDHHLHRLADAVLLQGRDTCATFGGACNVCRGVKKNQKKKPGEADGNT